MLDTRVALRRVLLGRPRASRQLRQRLVPRWMGTAVFSPPLFSSVAYAAHELLLVLALAGAGALVLATPLAAVVVLLLALVVVVYRWIIAAYPHGGGAYVVARDNLGAVAGVAAGALLLLGYALTVAVSLAAVVGVAAAAVPELAEHRVIAALALLVAVGLLNLRGLRDAGLLFAVPVCGFLALMAALLLTGLVRCGVGLGGCPAAPSAGVELEAAQALTLVVVLRAVSAGAALLGGVELFSQSPMLLRYPQARNAVTSMTVAGLCAGALLLGVGLLAQATGVRPTPGAEVSVLPELGAALLGDSIGLWLVVAFTAALLLLAAHTGLADFCRFASVLARDRWLPRQLQSRGDRLAFSNSVAVLAAASGALLIVHGASVSALVPLYVVVVFAAFTLGAAGMGLRTWRLQGRDWLARTVLCGCTAVGCAGVLIVATVASFLAGGWLILVVVVVLGLVMRAINGHYRDVSLRLRRDIAETPGPRPIHAVVLLDRVDEAAARALSYVLSTRPASVRALGVPLPNADLEARWTRLAPDVPLEVLQGARERGTAEALTQALVGLATSNGPQAFTTAVIPETLTRSWIEQLRDHRLALRVKGKLYREPQIVVTDVTSPVGGPGPYTLEEPAEHHVIVFVSAVNAASLQALAYAETLHASSVRALMVSLDATASARLIAEWEDWGLTTPLEIVDSPFRSLSATVRSVLREFAPDGRHTVVTAVFPTFVLDHPLQVPLHNQSALLVKTALLFERGVVTTSVPYPLRSAEAATSSPTERAARGG